MINKVGKGRRTEKEFIDCLKKYYACWKPSRSMFNSNDIFGLFDMCYASSNIFSDNKIYALFEKLGFLQIKSSVKAMKEALPEIKEFAKLNHISGTVYGCVARLKPKVYSVVLYKFKKSDVFSVMEEYKEIIDFNEVK